MTNLVAALTEGEIFDALGLEYREPWERNCEATPKTHPAIGGGSSGEGAPAAPPPEVAPPAVVGSNGLDPGETTEEFSQEDR